MFDVRYIQQLNGSVMARIINSETGKSIKVSQLKQESPVDFKSRVKSAIESVSYNNMPGVLLN